MQDVKHVVHFHGSLAEEFGNVFTIYSRDIRDTIKGLTCGLGKVFETRIKEGAWHITQGEYNEKDKDSNNFILEETVDFPIFEEEIHIFPAIMGAGAVGRIVIGVVLIVAAVIITIYSAGILAAAGGALTATALNAITAGIASVGVGLLAGGITELLSTTPSFDNPSDAEVDKNPSFLFNGAVNNTEQGGAINLIIGRHYAGSTVISVNIDIMYKTANANFIPNQSAKFDIDNDFGNWNPVNATLEVFKGSMLVHPDLVGAPNPDLAEGKATLTIQTTPGKDYTFSCLAAKRKNTTSAGIKVGGTEVTTTEEELTYLSGLYTATGNSVEVELLVTGRRGHFDDIYFAELGFNYLDSPLVDIDKADGVNPR